MSLITHQETADGIHQLTFKKASRASIEELTDLLEKMYLVNKQSNYCILDLSHSGMLPIRYLTYQMRRLHNRFPHHNPIHIAIVLNDDIMVNMSQVLLRTVMQRDKAQYFTDIDKAKLWLNIEQKKAVSRQEIS